MADAAAPPDSLFAEIGPDTVPVPLVVSIPHTGVRVTPDVARAFASPAMAALPITDWHLHALYDFLPGLGATTIHARYSRVVVDLNRPPDAAPLYPGRFETGLVPLETFQGESIFSKPPNADEIEARRRRFHAPYHARLRALLAEHVERFGFVVLIDAHSVASTANRVHGALEDEIYLGDCEGVTCEPWLRDSLASALRDEGLSVAVNQIYKGGYITRHYGAMPGVDAIQIEMAQRVYMDEKRPADAVGEPLFSAARERLRRTLARLANQLRERISRA